jgi:sugar lactone lactonase YvrE
LTSRCIKKITPEGVVTTVAGKCDLQQYNPTYKEGDIQSATLVTPGDIAVNKNGDIYFSDSRLNRIIKISNSKVITVAGNSKIVRHVNIGGYSEGGYADGKAKLALFHEPLGIAFDAAGNLYVADFENKCIRKITPDGMVSTLGK